MQAREFAMIQALILDIEVGCPECLGPFWTPKTISINVLADAEPPVICYRKHFCSRSRSGSSHFTVTYTNSFNSSQWTGLSKLISLCIISPGPMDREQDRDLSLLDPNLGYHVGHYYSCLLMLNLLKENSQGQATISNEKKNHL